MLRPTAKEVYPQSGHRLRIVFDNGEVRVFDVTPYIRGEWYGHLSDESYFRAVKPDGFTVVWPEGQDICPDELYTCSVAASQAS